jgi:hypothetical protein
MAVIRAMLPASIARTSSRGSMPDSTASARRGPIPLTAMRCSKISSSSGVENP